jgi:PAS domain S-box-containing protein
MTERPLGKETTSTAPDALPKPGEAPSRWTDENFGLLLAAVSDRAMVLLDAAGKILGCNDAAQRLTGFRADEIVGEHFSRFYPRPDVERGGPQHDLERAAAAGGCEVEGWRLRKDGSSFCARQVLTALRDPVGGLRGFATLTCALAEAGQIAGEPLAGPRQGSAIVMRTLLYVEDNTANLQLVEQIVGRRPDLRLLSARNGTLGIELARSAQPDVILMDINLPGMSGIRAMQILRSERLTAHIPVVALSANALPRDIERGLEAGFFRYLTKPLRIEEFLATLDVALAFAEKAVK